VGRGGGFYQELAVELTVTRHEGYALARISGPLDESARPAFREQLHPLIAERGTRLIVDLSSSQRINSPGIGNLVALVADANTNDSKVIFAAPTAFIPISTSRRRWKKPFAAPARPSRHAPAPAIRIACGVFVRCRGARR
jgi:anti-anti-sigma regulatory factor